MSGKKLLVADDSLTIQKVIRLALSSEGYEIQTVSDGNDAIQQIAVFRPNVVLIDISLPKKNAFEVKESTEMHEGLGSIPFVVMLSAFEKVDQQKIDNAQFQGKLTKPFDPAHLREVLNQVLSSAPATPHAEPMPTVTPSSAASASEPPEMPPQSVPLNPPQIPEWEPLELTPPPLLRPTLTPQIPVEMPPVPSAPEGSAEPVVDIWSQEKKPAEPESDSDIKHLTESTIRMSGLDDFQWSINEPVIQPTSNQLDQGGGTFSLESPTPALPQFQSDLKMEASELPPLPSFEPPPPSPSSLLPPEPPRVTIPISTHAPAVPVPSTSPVSKEEIEAMIQKQVTRILEEMAQKTLPEVAERVIKEEIRKLLSE